MAAIYMDGKALAAKVKEEVAAQVAGMERKPGLAVVLVGDNPASRVYVNGKKKDCAECGIYSEEYAIPAETTQQELLELVETLNGRENIDGIQMCIRDSTNSWYNGLRETKDAHRSGRDTKERKPYERKRSGGAPLALPAGPERHFPRTWVLCESKRGDHLSV